MPNAGVGESENLRPRRSRKDRPCDHCRRAKRSCHITVRGEACTHCRKANRQCSFDAPPLNRHRRASSSPQAQSTPSARRELHLTSSGPGTSTATFSRSPHTPSHPLRPSHPSRSSGPPHAPHPPHSHAHPPGWMAERSTIGAPRERSSVAVFLDSLEEDEAPRRHDIDDDSYNSLELGVTEEEESHYLGSGAVAQLASVSLDSRIEARNADALPYRQVADPRYPAYFLKNPSKVYGLSNAAFIAEKAYQDVLAIVSAEDPGMPERLIQHFLKRTLPTLPILNQARFEASLRGWSGGGRFPYALLVAIFAHSAVYEPSLRRHCKDMWSIHLHVCDNEYRQPRLQIIQLEIFNITGRPILNPGGNHLGIARAVGTIQLLGLHRDCSHWKLPKWERSLRKRLWWTLYICDKWNAYTYGRPVNLERARSGIPPLTLDDDDQGRDSPPDNSDISCFIALTRLAVILENILPLVLERDTGFRRDGPDRAVLVHAASDLDEVYRDLSSDLVFSPTTTTYPLRPGCRSLQLAHLGITVLICRLGLERDDFATLSHLTKATSRALAVIDGVATFVEHLTADDFHSHWAPWSAFQLSNAVTLLLQQAIRVNQHASAEPGADDMRVAQLKDLFVVLSRLVHVIQSASERGWDVAESATPRIKGLIKSMPHIPGIEGVQAMTDSAVPDWMPTEPEPQADIFALFDWLNGDRVF